MLRLIIKPSAKYARLLAKENFNSKTKNITFASSTSSSTYSKGSDHKISETLDVTWGNTHVVINPIDLFVFIKDT